MKKYILVITLLFAVAMAGYSQNANRSGFFLEAGAGFPIGTPPLKGIEWKNNTLMGYYPGGTEINFGFGYRRASSRCFAWEVKAEASTVSSSFRHSLVLAAMPGIRYTTKELFGNTSLYFGLNVGFAYAPMMSDMWNGIYRDDENDLDLDDGNSLGAKLLLNVGVNITSSFYAGLYFDYNVMSDMIQGFSSEDSYNYREYFSPVQSWGSWGAVGLRLGYRF